MPQWVNYITTYQQSFRVAVRDAMLTTFSLLRYVPQHIIEHNEISHVICPQRFKCTLCDFKAPTMQQLQLHMFKTHNWLHPSQYYIDADCTMCSICMMQFHTRVRLIEHLRYKGRRRHCLDNIYIYIYIVRECLQSQDEHDIIARDAEKPRALARSGYRRTKAQAPAYRICGPLRPDLVSARPKVQQ